MQPTAGKNGGHSDDARPKRGDEPARPDGVESSRKRRAPWPLMLVAALFIVVPFLAWYGTWFGRALGDEEIEKYLSEGKPRQAQHALSAVAERIERGDAGVSRFYTRVRALAESPSTDLRMTAAWVMGLEHKSEEFRAALLRLVEDREPIVRRNAALALVRFGDSRSLPELRAMLRSFEVRAASGGTALTALSVGTPVKRDSLLVRYNIGEGDAQEVRSPLPGKVEQALVKEGGQFRAEDRLFVIGPDPEHVRDALIGLSYLGEGSDSQEVERFARGVEGMPEAVRTQAARTLEDIKRRSAR